MPPPPPPVASNAPLRTAFGLVDCNNFYVACERLFRPDLDRRPVVVLSNNDGCVVSRSPEAKALGIPMGAPWFQYAERMERAGVTAFSSNYTLYADMSRRVMKILDDLVPAHEVYSIDECFLVLDELRPRDALRLAQEARARVAQWTGLPVCIGLGTTRTLAKLANFYAKKHLPQKGIAAFDAAYTGAEGLRARLDAIDVAEVWGIGRRLAPRLKELGWHTAGELSRAPSAVLRKQFSVVVERTGLELRGLSCVGPEDIRPHNDHAARQQIMSSRSFGDVVTTFADLQAATLTRMMRAGEKLRADGLVARTVLVFAETGKHDARGGYRRWQKTETLPAAVSDPVSLGAAAARGARAVWGPDRRYRKSGVMLLELAPGGGLGQPPGQGVLFGAGDQPFDPAAHARREQLGALVDGLNARLGRGTVAVGLTGARPAASGPAPAPWRLRCERQSAALTTDWQALPAAH